MAVLGMGVGGLAAATLLTRRGHHVVLYDKMASPAPVGSGFVLQPTGLVALARMGMLDAAAAMGARIDRMLGIVLPSGRTVLDVGYRNGASGLAMQRSALFSILHAEAAACGVEFRLGRSVTGIEEAKLPRPIVEGRGERSGYDLVVDAMGCRSPTHQGGREIEYGALWATVPWANCGTFDANTLEQRYQRASRMAGVLPVGIAPSDPAPKATVFWSVRQGAEAASWKDDAARLWPEMAPLLEEARPVHATYRHHTRRPIAQPRVVRIGDAWHATSPQLGQGANMALLDALSLDMALDRTNDIHAGLAAHVRQRQRHVSVYQAMSWLLTPFYQSDGRILPSIRDHLVAPMLRRRGIIHALVSSIVAGGMTNPIRSITNRYEEEVMHIARTNPPWLIEDSSIPPSIRQ